MRSKVAIIECDTYKKVELAIHKAVTLLGGWEAFIKPGESILLKPNLLAKCSPDQACTTHPEVFYSVGKLLQEAGYTDLFYGDSPGNHLIGVAQTADGCGILEKAEQLGIQIADFEHGTKVDFPQGHKAKEFVICDGVQDKDAIINLCKMKTHQLERVTGAVKNIFGCVYGFNKGASHAIYPNAEVFAQMLGDLNCLVKPRLHIMDGVLAMEGNGPQSGEPTYMNVILVSEDPVALDTVFCHLVHLDPKLVATNVYGQEYGIGTMENIELISENGIISMETAVEKWGNPDFDVARDSDFKGRINAIRFLQPLLERKPFVKKEKCVGCGICIQACPLEPKAIALKNGKPVYDHKICIKCYCCQEMCPKKAIDVKEPILAKLAGRQWKI